jgi:hypothetical protein
MEKRFFVLSGTGVVERRERANSATAAMELILKFMRRRYPGVRIEDEFGYPLSFFELKDLAAGEAPPAT